MGRHVHDEDMADAPRGTKAGRRGRDRPHQFVGMQAALHQEFALAGADQLDALGGRVLAVRTSTSSYSPISRSCFRATAAIFAAGPTNIGLMMPASAASTGPRSEVSSQGCTTTVEEAGTSLRPRNQLLVFCVRHGSDPPGDTGSCRSCTLAMSTPRSAFTMTALATGISDRTQSRGFPPSNSATTRSHSFGGLAGGSPLAD